jgi:hypothetical protein
VSDHPERQTTERLDVRRALFLERLVRIWDEHPDRRLGEIIVLALDMSGTFDVEVLRNVDDMSLAERIERWAMRNSSG